MSRCTSLKSGVTLIEVLVSMLILSIGVALLSTLLPISILRTAQASQLTQAVFLRNNAEAYLESYPLVLSNAQIAVNSLAVVDPLGLQIMGSNTFAGIATVSRTGCGTTTVPQAESLATLPDSWKIAIDERPVVATNTSTIPYSVTLANPTIASLFVRNSTTPLYASHRVVMTDVSGKNVVIRPILQVLPGTPIAGTGNELSWWDPINTALNPGATLPAGYVPVRARVESSERRFSWLMTVAKREVSAGLTNFNWAAEIDCVIFFNRAFSTNDEFKYTVSQTPANGFDGLPGVAGVDDDRNGTTDDLSETGWLGSDDNRTVTVTIPGGTTPAPFLRKGGFMLEPTQLKWYRIINLPVIGTAPTTVQLLLDRDLKSTPGTPIATGIFMKGIVDVFSLGVRTGQQ